MRWRHFSDPASANAMSAIGISDDADLCPAHPWPGTMSVKVEVIYRGRGAPWHSALAYPMFISFPKHNVRRGGAGDVVNRRRDHSRGGRLSFLGLGKQPPAPSWGKMLQFGAALLTKAPWMALGRGLAIFLVGAVVQSWSATACAMPVIAAAVKASRSVASFHSRRAPCALPQD